jgi:hypothetical protein
VIPNSLRLELREMGVISGIIIGLVVRLKKFRFLIIQEDISMKSTSGMKKENLKLMARGNLANSVVRKIRGSSFGR